MKKGGYSAMDRRVKERLVGAALLMVLAVLIVPELLSGPKRVPQEATSAPATLAEPIRNVTVDLATNKEAPAEDLPASSADAVASGVAAQEPPPSLATLQAQQPQASSPSSPSVPQAPSPVENPPSAPTLNPATPRGAAPRAPASHDLGQADGTHRHWAAQIGTFASRANAEKLEHQLKAQNFPAYIVSGGDSRSPLYRVRVGPMADRATAEHVIAKLHKEGHTASVVVP
jgi:DedD protein